MLNDRCHPITQETADKLMTEMAPTLFYNKDDPTLHRFEEKDFYPTDLICDELKKIGIINLIKEGFKTYEAYEEPKHKIGDTISVRRNPLEKQMLNDRWAKRMMRATKTENTNAPDKEIIEAKIVDAGNGNNVIGENALRECGMKNRVQNHERIMNYLQKENVSGHAHNLDMLLASLNINQHLREAFLSAEVSLFEGENKDNDFYLIQFPFGTKTIEYKLSKRAVESE